jgi:arabinogalactan oligomer/maltooligosaccharide transport system substrate-binding protein
MKLKMISCAVAATATLMGASSFAFAKEEVLLWHAYRGAEKKAMQEVVDNFNKSSKEYSVKTLAVPYDAYADKITAAIPRGRGPDVFIYAQDRLGGWVEANNTIEPIDFFLDGEDEQFIPSTMEAMNYRGTNYGLPLNYKNVTLIYNKKLVPTPPKTTDEMIKVAKSLTDKQNGIYGLAYAFSNFYYHASIMNAFGGKVFEKGPKAVLDSKENLKALDFMLDMYQNQEIMPGDPSSALITNLFNKGKAAMIIDGPWILDDLSQDIDIGLASLPTVSQAGGEPMRPWMTVEGVYISMQSKKKDAAWELVKHLTNTESGKVMALVGRQTPANSAVYDDAKVAADPRLAAFRKQVETALPMPNIAEMSIMWSPVTTAMNKIVKGTPAKFAMKEAQEQVSKDVANLRRVH